MFRIEPELEEAYHEQAVYESQFDSTFVYPEWLAWLNCPLHSYLCQSGLESKWYWEKDTRRWMEYARSLGLMMIKTVKGIEFRPTAIVRRM